jgi:hypothetical protein
LYKPPHGKAPPPPKPLPGVPATKSAAPNGEPGDNPPAPPENAPPENANIRGKWIEEHKVYKCGFRNILNTPPLENTVHNVVNHVTKTCYQVSRLLQLHIQRIIENNLEFPDINPTWIRRLFRLVQDIFPARDEDDYVPDDLITTYNTLFRSVIGSYAINNAQASSQVTSYIVQNYVVNINTHINTHYESMNKLWVKQSLMHRGLPETQSRRLSIEIWDYCIGQHDGNEDDADEMEAFKQEWQRYINPITQNNTTVQAKLQRMYSLNILFTAWQCKVYTLVPIYTHDAKYIRIDTRALYELLGSTQGTGLSLVQFSARREEFFRIHFNLPSRLFNRDTRTPCFNYMLDTDGVGASVHIFRWKWIIIRPNETSTERENRLAEAREERFTRLFQNIQGRAGEHDLHWVGVDPGRKNVVTASKLDDDNEHWSFKLSSAEYHHRIKANERKEKKDTQLRKAGVSEWLLESPTMKTHSAAATLSCIQRTFASNHLHQIFNINSTRKTKHMRWKVYMHRLKTIDQTCKSMLGDDPSNTIIAYGGGKFNPSSPGYKPSPTRSSYFANRLKKVHNATVLNIWEFNTSQICSKCHAPVKLCGVATQQDPFMTPANIVQTHHFVRRCTNNLCRIIWNRDVNAARNMAFLGIHLVYQVDRPDPFNASVPYPPSVQDNDVLQAAAPA